jgi:hypothetical protein
MNALVRTQAQHPDKAALLENKVEPRRVFGLTKPNWIVLPFPEFPMK